MKKAMHIKKKQNRLSLLDDHIHNPFLCLPFSDSSEFSVASPRTRAKVVPLLPPTHYSMLSDLQSLTEKKEEENEITLLQRSPLYSFMYALKSSEAKRQYPKRLKMLFDFLGLPGSLEEHVLSCFCEYLWGYLSL